MLHAAVQVPLRSLSMWTTPKSKLLVTPRAHILNFTIYKKSVKWLGMKWRCLHCGCLLLSSPSLTLPRISLFMVLYWIGKLTYCPTRMQQEVVSFFPAHYFAFNYWLLFPFLHSYSWDWNFPLRLCFSAWSTPPRLYHMRIQTHSSVKATPLTITFYYRSTSIIDTFSLRHTT